MTIEEKQLLIKDLSARLPYGVIVQYKQKTFCPAGEYNVDVKIEIDGMLQHRLKLLDFKPYLRPMSSMTEDEKKEFKNQFGFELCIDEIWGHSLVWNTGSSDEYIDVEFELVDIDLISVWLDKKMFDWRRIKKDNKKISMIKAGLALEAPKGMYNIK